MTTPVLRLVKGDATPEEIAAVVAVLSAASGGGPSPAPDPSTPSRWAAPQLRQPLHPGPGAWQASYR